MAQGQLKKPNKPSSSSSSSAKTKRPEPSNRTRRGARVIKPKKAKLLEQRKVIKKHTAALTAKTERTLAQRAGHLELLKGGKKEGKEAGRKVEIKKKD